MEIELIKEPLLQFGTGTHIDIRFGLMEYKPFDYTEVTSPKNIKLGIIGTNETIEGVCRWLESCKTGVAAKKSKQPHLFPAFPGFGSDTNLPATLLFGAEFHRTIGQQVLDNLDTLAHINDVVSNAVEIFYEEIEHLIETYPIDVAICAVPDSFLILTDKLLEEARAKNPKATYFDFHDLLKAKVMNLRIHTQIILPGTYDESKFRSLGNEKNIRLQDEATRAWNFYTALYYKAKGIPYRLVRSSTEFTTCYIGVSFYRDLEHTKLETSVAQVFNERGDGVIVRGGAAKFSKDDKQPHLTAKDSYSLLNQALDIYRKEHRTLPARIVLHKSSNFNQDETSGFQQALSDQHIEMRDFLTLRDSESRLFRNGSYPPRRGTFWKLDNRNNVLYTRGSVDFFGTYPGMYVPKPLLFVCESVEQTSRTLAEEIMGLTKMNWNKTQFDGSDPITIVASREVGKILKYINQQDAIQTRYSFYM